MTELKLVRNAAGWLRGFVLTLLGLLISSALITIGVLSASSNTNASSSKVDYAASLNGTSQFFIRNSVDGGALSGVLPANGDFTAEMWFLENTGTTGCRDIFGVGDAGNADARFEIRLGGEANRRTLTVFERNSTALNESFTVANRFVFQNQWNHVAVSHRAGVGYYVYLNGQLVHSEANTSTAALTFGNVTIGRNYFNETCYFNGQIDEVRTWNRELSGSEISTNMHRRMPGNSTGLLYYWDFNEGSTGNAFDVRANTPMVAKGSPNRIDVKQVSALQTGETVITFPRTYLPGIGGWEAPAKAVGVQVLVVGGGGSGGAYVAGGGGGGGVQQQSIASLNASTYSIVVGQGGVAVGTLSTNRDQRVRGLNGQNSSAFGITSLGGGGGGAAAQAGLSGASGGGAGFFTSNTVLGGSGTSGQGFAGGNAQGGRPGDFTAGAGGGGAGGTGEGVSNALGRGGNGGAGTASSILGVQYFFGGGGGGGAYYPPANGRGGHGGIGGGGAGSVLGTSTVTTANGGGSAINSGESVTTGGDFTVAGSAGANTGGGGGGVGHDGISGAGGSGVVIVRYMSGSDTAVNMPNSSTANLQGAAGTIPAGQFTFETWAFIRSIASTAQVLFSQSVDNNNKIYLIVGRDVSNANPEFLVGWGDQSVWTDIPVPTARWFHAAITRDSSGAGRLFIDGNLVWTSTLNSTLNATSGTFSVGSHPGGIEPLNGQLDQIKVWTVALGASELANSMHAYGATQSNGVAVRTGVLPRAHFDFNDFQPSGVEENRGSAGSSLDLVMSSGISQASYTDSLIVETSSAFGTQTVVEFNRSYLTAAGGWVAPPQASRYKALIVAGGGGGGSFEYGGGGGAGGMYVLNATTLSPSQPIPVIVGQGGNGGIFVNSDAAIGSDGQASSLGNLSAPGGGGGGGKAWLNTELWATGRPGGSGGGHGEDNIALAAAASTFNDPAAGKFGNPGGALTFTGGSQMGTGGGGAGSAGTSVTQRHERGNGGAGRSSSITGASVLYAAGGGGGSYQASSGLGGSSIGGNGATSTLGPTPGATNTGSGGGGGSTQQGGSGGSGAVILSYGTYLEVTRSPVATRVGSAFSNSIQVQLTNLDGSLFSSNSPVTVTSSAALILNGVPLTQSLTVNAVNGIATFAGLGFASSVTSAQTLTFSSDAFVGTSVTITPTFFANNLVINSSNTSTGFMFGGEFYASSSAGVSFLNVSDLHGNAVANTISISVSGSISISSAVNISISGRSVTFRAGADIHVGNVNVLTQGPLNFFSDADGSGSGSFNSDSSSLVNSQGGRIVISGGLDPTTGYAVGSSNSQWSGARILGDLWSGGGDIIIRGDSGANVTVADVTSPNWTAGVMLGSKTVDSGTGSISISGAVNRHSDNTEVHYGVSIGTSDATANGVLKSSTGGISIRIDSSPSTGANKEGFGLMRANVLSDTGAITISAIASGAAYEIDVDNGRASRVSTSGSITIEGRGAGSEDLGSLILSSPAQISIRGDKPEINSGFVITSSPVVAIESFGASFSAPVDTANMTIGSATRGFRLGKTTNTAAVTLGSSMSINGPIEVYGSDISVTNKPNLMVTSQSARLVLKATRNIDVVAGTATNDRSLLQTNNGDIILWVNSANGGSGYLYLGDYSVLNSANGATSKTGSGGGRITLAGGSETDAAGHPVNGIPGISVTSRNEGLWAAPNSKIYSGGGDVYIAVAHKIASYQAAAFRSNSLIWSGTGRITATVSHTATTGTSPAIELANTSWISAATISPAIQVTARVSNGSYALYNSSGESFTFASLASTGGGVSVSALTPTATHTSQYLWGFNLESRGGRIDFSTNGVSNWNSSQARAFGAGLAQEISSSSADVFITTQSLGDSTGNTSSKISTSGVVSLQPFDTTFTAATRLRFSIEAGDLYIGTSSAIASYTNTFNLDRPVTVSRNVHIYANAVTLNSGADISSLTSGSTVEIGSVGTTTHNSRIIANSDVRLFGAGMSFSTGFISTSRAIVIDPYQTSFTSAVSTVGLMLDSSASSLRVGRESNTGAITIGSNATINGPISVIGGDLTMNTSTSLISSSVSARILMKASGFIMLNDGTSTNARPLIRTSNGDLILWGDSDGNGTGKIYVGAYAVLDSSGGRSGNGLSGGGRITIAGSYGNAGVDSQGHPLGSISLGAVNDWTLVLQNNSTVFSGGGEIDIRVNSGANYDAFGHNQSEVNAGTGQISVVAISRASKAGYLNQGGSFISAATLSPAIEINSQTNGSNVAAFTQADGYSLSVVSTGDVQVGISISAITGATAGNGVVINQNIDLLSAIGDISFFTNGYFNIANDNIRNFGAKASSLVPSSSGDIRIVTSYWVDTVGNSTSKISTSGDVSVVPFADNFLQWMDFRFTVESGDFTIGKPGTVATSDKYVYVMTSITASGAITVAANEVYIHNNIDVVTTGPGEPLVFMARERVEIRAGSTTNYTKIQSNGGPITIWSDADANGTGPALLYEYVSLNSTNGDESKTLLSGGGDITIGGGTDSNADGKPDGFAANSSGVDRGVLLYWGVKLYSGGGDIVIRAKSSSTYGVLLYSNNEIFSGAGKIDIYGEGASYGTTFIDTGWCADCGGQSGPLTIVSHTSQSPAISIIGKTAGNGQGLRLLGWGTGNIITIASTATTGGGVNLYGEAGSGASIDFHLLRADVLSRTGAITVSSNVKSLTIDHGQDNVPNRFGSAVNSAYVTTSSANVSILGNNLDFNGGAHTFRTLGDVAIQPKTANAFDASYTFAFSTDGVRNLTIGKNPIAGDPERDVTLTGDHTVSGEIKIYGGSINPNGRLATTGNGSVLLKALANIQTPQNARYVTQGGDITFWSDSDNSGSGFARFNDNNTILTNGGDITIAGGLDDGGTNAGITGRVAGDGFPDGFATDASNTIYRGGVELRSGRNFQTSGGDVFIAARGGGNAIDRYAMFSAGGTTNAGSGTIQIWARMRASQTSGEYNFAWFAAYDTGQAWSYTTGGRDSWVSSASNKVAIDINVDTSNATGAYSSAINASLAVANSFEPSFRLAATGPNGGVRIRAIGGSNNAVRADGMGAPVVLRYSEILAQSGDVLIESTISATAPLHPGVSFGDTPSDNTNATWKSSDRTYLGASAVAGSPVTSSSANITIRTNSIDFNDGSAIRRSVVSTSGTLAIEPLAASFRNELSTLGLDAQVANLRIGKASNTSSILVPSGHQVAVSGSATFIGGSFSNTVTVSAGVGVAIQADDVSLGVAVQSPNGYVQISPRTANRAIDLGTNTSGRLSLTNTEMSLVEASRFRIGSATTGDILLTSNVSLSAAKVVSILLSTPASVVASNGAILTAPNLAIDAGGGVNLPGSNSVSGAVAISASSMVTYSSAVSYSAETVDNVLPVFGIGRAISQTNSPSVQDANEFLAVTFNPPPQVVITDAYNKVLDGNNRTAYTYTVSASVASGSGVVQGLTSSSRVGGLVTFNALKVTSGIGVYAFTFSAELSPSSTITARSVDYNVMAGEPGELAITATDTSSPAGQLGFDITVTVKDSQGNPLISGPNSGLTVSATISGSGGEIVSGNEAAASTSNAVADFSDLVLGGSTDTTYSLSFSVTYTDVNNQQQTLTSSPVAISLTPGPAYALSVSPSSLVATYSELVDPITVRVLDSYSNVVTSNTSQISISAATSQVSGTSVSNAVAGTLVFNDLRITGTKTTHTLTFTSAGVRSASAVIDLKYLGRLTLARNADFGIVGKSFGIQPLIQVLDSAGATSTANGLSISAAISAGSSLQGVSEVSSSAGLGSFTSLALASGTLGQSYELTFSAPGYDSVTQSTIVYVAQAGDVDVTTAGTTQGAFLSGLFYATANPANINRNDLNSQFALGSVEISASGTIDVTASISSGVTGSNLTLKSVGSISATAGVTTLQGASVSAISGASINWMTDITTNGGNVWFQSRASGAATGDIVSGGNINTTGGNVYAFGGQDPFQDYAVARETGNGSGVYMSSRVNTGGGDILIRGSVNTASSAAGQRGAWLMSSLIATSGGDITVSGRVVTRTNSATVEDAAIEVRGTVDVGSGNLHFDVNGAQITNTARERIGVYLYLATIRASTGNITINSDLVQLQTSNNVFNRWLYADSSVIDSGSGVFSGNSPSTKNELFLKDSVVSSSGVVSMTSGNLEIKTGNHFRGPGRFIFEPSGAGFSREVYTHFSTFSNEITYLRFGKPLGQADSSFYYFSGKQIDVNGPLVVNGERVQVYEKLKTSSSSAEISIVGGYFVHVFGGGVESAGSISISSLVVSNSAPISASGNVTLKADPRLWATVSSAVGQIYFSAYNGSFSADMPQSPSADHWLLSSKEMSLLKTPKLVTRANNLYLRMSVSPQAVGEWMLEGETLRTWDASQISASNVAISLSRSVDLPGLNRIKNLAIASPLVTYSSAIDYLPTTVSGVTPRFGVPASIVASKVPTNSPTSIYAGATISPAPIATVRDANGLALQTRNLLARTVTVSAAVATGNATLANTSSSSISGGVQEFTNLRIVDGSGDVTLAFTLNSADGQIGSTVTTGTYRLSNPDPASLSVVVSDASAGAGLAGFGIAVTVRADDNTALAAGPNSGITVSASVSGQSVQIVSGAKVRTNGSGVADFSQLKLSGSVSDSISISFSVNFIDYLGAEQTISSIVYALNLTPGDAKTLVIDDDSQSVANRSTFSAVTISLLDAYGNKLVSRSDTVTATIGSGSGANLVGTKQIVFPAGANSDAEVTFDNLALQGTIGNYRIDFASNQAGISSVSHEVTLTYGAATRIALDTQASGARAGISFTQQPKLSLRDADSNIVPGDVSISAAVTGPNLTGTQNIALTAGYATFSDLAIEGTAQSYGIQYEVTAPVGFTSFSVSQTIALAAGIPYKFAWEDQPANAIAGVNQQGNLKISLRDQWNNITSQSQTVSVEVALVSATDSAQVRSVMSSYSVSPLATSFSFLAADSSVNLTGTYRLKVSAASFDSAVSDQFVIGNAAPSKLVVLQDVPASIRSGITFSPALKVEVLDSFNNRVVDRALSLSASVISGSAISLTGEDVELVAGSSSVEFPDLAIEAKAANLRLRVSLGGAYAASNISISSGVFAVTFGAPTQLTVSPVARSVANRTAIDEILVTVLDSAGNQVEDSTALISVTTSGIVLTGTLNRYAASGASSFSDLVPEGAVGNYDLSFESAGLSGATVSLAVTHGSATYVNVLMQERSKNNSVLRDIGVEIVDANNNLVSTGPESNQTVVISADIATFSGITAVSASGGIATFSGLVLTGSVSADVEITTTIQLPFQIVNETRYEIQPGDPHSLDLTTLAAGFANREIFGAAPAITVRDISGNVVPSSGMDVRLTVDTASISGSITASAETGYATFSPNLVLRGLAGSHSLVFTAEGTSSSGVVSASQTILLNHGAASQLVVTRAASNVWAGQNFGVQPKVELRDPEGNRVSTSNLATATIDVSYSGAGWSAQNRTGVSLLGARAISLSAGIGEFTNLEFEGRVGSYTLDFVVREDQAISTSDVVAVESGTPVGINVLVEPQDIIAGEAFANTLSAEIIDDFDNRVVRVTSSATLKASLITSTPTTAVITESAEFEVNAGVATFSGLTFTSAGTRYLQFDAGPSSSLQNISGRTTYTFLISHAAPDEIVWVTQPVASVQNWKVVTGQGGPYPKLKAVDRFGNLASSATMSVDVSVDPSVQAVEQNGRMFNQGYATFDGLKIRATSGSYTVKFEADFDSGPVFSSISHVIEVTYGDPDYLDVATHPSTARAGTPFATQPVIEIRDSGGNLVENSTLSVTVTAQGAALTGQTQATAVTGVATFTGVELSGSISSTVTLSYTANFNGQAIEFAEETLVLNPGTADYMTLHWTAADIQTRAAISPAPEVKLWDEFGNLVTLDSSTQVVAKLMRLGSVVTTSTQVFTANAGVVDFTGLTFIATPNQGYSLRFESTGLDVVSSSAVTVLPGPVARVEIIDEPGSGAGATQARTGNALPQQPRIKLVDFDGNIVTTVNAGSITAQIASGQNGTVVSASASISAGIAQFTQLGLIGRVATPTQSAEVYRLEFAYQNFTSSPSAQLTLKHNVAEKIVQIQDAVGGQAGLDFATQPKVKVVDRFGNTVYDDSSITILAIPEVAAGTGQASVAGSNQAQTDASGIATFDMGISGSVNNTYKLTFKDFDEQLITASQSGIVITPGQARQLYILRAASATDANQVRTKTGQAFLVQPVIEIRDDYGNRVNSNATITVSLSSTVRGARDYLKNYTISAQAGVATFSGLAMVVLPETNYQLTYKFGGNTTAFTQTEPLWVTHADAEYITIERQPQGGNKTGNSLSLSPSVTVRDFDGNPTTMISGETVSAVISQGNGSVTANGDATVVAGVATFNNLTLVALPGEAQRLRFELQGFNNSASSIVKSVDSDAITLTFSDAHQLSVIQQPSANAITAELLGTQPQVVVQDRFGNTVSNYVGSVWVESQAGSRLVDAQDQTIGSISAVVVNGVATFNTLRIEGDANQSFALSFASGALATTTSNAVTLGHTSAAYLTVTSQPVGAVTGQLLANQPEVRIFDRFDNLLDTDNSSQITVSVFSGDTRPGGQQAEISGSRTVTVQGGVATFAGLKFTGRVGSDYIWQFSDGVRTVNSSTVRVSAAGAYSFEWVQLPQVDRTGELMPTPAVLRALDFDGNLAVSSSDTVTVTVTGGGYIESGTTSQIVNGYATFSNLILVATPAVAQQLTFTATAGNQSFAISTQQNLVLRHTTASELRINRSPSALGQQGSSFASQPQIHLYDRYGNKAIYDNSTVVTAAIASGVAGATTGSATVAANAGEANFSTLGITGSPGVAYTLNYAANLGFSITDNTALKVFKTADIQLSYPTVNFSLSATVAPTVAVTDSTEKPLVFTSRTTQYCTVNGSTGVATIVSAGTCEINVSVADGTYYKQNSIDVNLVINRALQAPLLMTNPNFVDFGQVLTLTHSGGSSTATPEYYATGTCRAFGNQLMFSGDATEGSTASCTVRVIQDGDQNFEDALSPAQRITVKRIGQEQLRIGNSRETAVGDVELFTVGGSGGGSVSYRVEVGQGTATCAIVDGNKLRATTNGWCEVSAQKAMSVNYNTASSPVVVFTFSKQVQVVSFTSPAPGMLLPGQSYQVAANASSGLTVSFAVTRGLEVQASQNTSYSPAVCSISGNTVTLIGTGTCEVTATQAGNAQFAQASAKLILTVGQLNQFIDFAQPQDLTYGSPVTRLGAIASSGLPVSYTTSNGVTACSVSTAGLLTLNSAGDCTVVASQGGDGRYAAAAPVTRTLRVLPDRASAPALVSAAVGNQWFTVGYTEPSYTGGSPIIGYRLEVTDSVSGDRYVNSACSINAPLTCTMVGLPNARSYSAKVAAITAAGTGRFSANTTNLVPTSAQISVTQLQADISGANLVMNWTPPAVVSGTFQRYEIYVWPTGGTVPTTPTATVNTLSATTTAVDVSSMSPNSSISQIANFSQPVFVSAFNLRSRVVIFGAVNQGPMGFIRLASSQSPVVIDPAAGFQMRVVTITDEHSSSQTINTATGEKLGMGSPEAPTQLTLDSTDPTKLIASWGAPGFDGGLPVIDYEVRSNGQVICANITTRMCEISPLEVSTTYRIEVRARNSIGFGGTASAQHTTPTPPPPQLLGGAELASKTPVFTSYSQRVLPIAGAKVLVEGTRLQMIQAISIAGKTVSYSFISNSQLELEVPALPAGTYDLVVLGEHGRLVIVDAFTFVQEPEKLTSIRGYVDGFLGKSTTLGKLNISRIEALFSKVPGADTVRCIGSIPTKAKISEIRLAKKRAEKTCAFIEKQYPGVKVTRSWVWRDGVLDFKRGQVRIILTTELLKGTI